MTSTTATRESAAIRVLLVSFEKASVEMLTDIMAQMGILVEVCADRKTAARHLCNSKYEGVVVDLVLGQDALDLLANLPDFTSNRSAVSCAILNEAHEKASAFQAGANFVLERPLNITTTARTLRAAYPMMVRERRRYFRCPVQTPTFVACKPHPEFQATSVNISEAGMAIQSPVPLKVGQSLRVRVRIPGNTEFIDVAGEVCWIADGSTRAGVQFLEISTSVAEALATWLLSRLEEMIPQRAGLTPQITQVGLNPGSTAAKLFRGN